MDSFQLFFDDAHNVLLAHFGTTLDERSIIDLCDGIARYVAIHGQCRGILDLTQVTNVNVTTQFLIQKSRINPLHNQRRVLVAPTDYLYGLSRLFQIYQGIETGDEPMIARSLDEACRLLNVNSPDFQLVESI